MATKTKKQKSKDPKKKPVREVVKKKQVAGKKAFYVDDIKVELKRVSWPSRETTIKASILILVIVVAFTAFISMVDILLSKIMLWLQAQ